MSITIDKWNSINPFDFNTYAEYQAALDKLVPPETDEAAAEDAARAELKAAVNA